MVVLLLRNASECFSTGPHRACNWKPLFARMYKRIAHLVSCSSAIVQLEFPWLLGLLSDQT